MGCAFFVGAATFRSVGCVVPFMRVAHILPLLFHLHKRTPDTPFTSCCAVVPRQRCQGWHQGWRWVKGICSLGCSCINGRVLLDALKAHRGVRT